MIFLHEKLITKYTSIALFMLGVATSMFNSTMISAEPDDSACYYIRHMGCKMEYPKDGEPKCVGINSSWIKDTEHRGEECGIQHNSFRCPLFVSSPDQCKLISDYRVLCATRKYLDDFNMIDEENPIIGLCSCFCVDKNGAPAETNSDLPDGLIPENLCMGYEDEACEYWPNKDDYWKLEKGTVKCGWTENLGDYRLPGSPTSETH